METPARLYIVQRPLFIDAVISKQIFYELLDPGTVGLFGPDLCQALAQEPGSLSQVRGPSGFSYRLSCFVVLDPEEGTARLGVD